MVELFKKHGFELFSPVGVKLLDGSISIITPPVFEKSGSKLVALEGNTRSTYCYLNEISKFKAIVVSGAKESLPGIPEQLIGVRIVRKKLNAKIRVRSFNYNYFRKIEQAIHQPEMVK